MIRNRIFRIRATMYFIPPHKFIWGADMLSWLTGSVQHQQTEQGQQPDRMYCIPSHKFNMADMLAWLTGSVQHQQTEQGQHHYRMYLLYTEA